MCGLIGMISRRQQGFFTPDSKVFESMMVFDTVRGRDSTGAVVGMRNGVSKVMKQAGDPFLLFRNKEWGSLMSDLAGTGRFALAHNRAATRGKVITANAHPFIEDNIILMHNGTLWEHGNLTDESVDVDSHAIAKALRVDGPDKVLPDIRGAFALLWYDTEQEKVFAVRNEERPLHLCTSDDAYYLVSEPWIAHIAAGRESKKIKETKQLEPGELLSFNLNGHLTIRNIELKNHTKNTQVTYGNDWKRHVDSELDGSDTEDCGVPFVAGQRPCALTKTPITDHSTMTPSTPTGTTSSSGNKPAEPNGPAEASSQVFELFDSTDFKPNEELLVHVKSCSSMQGSITRFRFMGTVMEPGREAVDVSGVLPGTVDHADVKDWVGHQVIAKILGSRSNNCGVTLTAGGVHLAGMMRVNNKEIAGKVWLHVLRDCRCKVCDAIIKPQDRKFTNVYNKAKCVADHYMPIQEISCMCADCIESKMPEGDVKDEFNLARAQVWEGAARETSRSIASVPDGQQRSGRTEGRTDSVLQLPSPKSLQ